MKIANYNQNGTLAHSADCVMAFGRKDVECPRCMELINGAAPRSGWQKNYYERKAFQEKMDALALANHNKNCSICNGSEKGVCTFGEW